MSLIRLQIAAGVLLAGAACSHVVAQTAPPPPELTRGEIRTAVVLVNFSDKPTEQPASAAFAHSLVFGSVSDFFWESSYQTTFLSGNTFGWFTIPVPSTSCVRDTIAAEADRAATAAGANIASYDRVIYMFPNNTGCSWSGVTGTSPTGQRQVFVNNNFNVYVVAHELGHTFGLLHSEGFDCDTGTLEANCVVRDHGDVADGMGLRQAHFNAFQKEQLGWLNYGGTPAITTATTSGRYTLAPFETMSGTKALKVLKSVDATTGDKTWYYIEYRQPIGFDTGLGTSGNLTKGVIVRSGLLDSTGWPTNLLLDMTPNSDNSTTTSDLRDGALAIGARYTDAAAGVSITLVSADANGAVVDVAISGQSGGGGGGTPAPAPLTESVGTDKTSYARGETVRMSALVKRDGAPVAGVVVTFATTAPGGVVASVKATTGADGFARATYKIAKGKSAAGRYGVRADASDSGGTATASTAYDAR